MPFSNGMEIACNAAQIVNDKKVTDHHAVIPTDVYKRQAADQAAELNEDGEAGLLRLTEIWCAMNGVPAIVIFEGGQRCV